jgi:outer membrane protein OmpA-like peptidoglycan-associated protein
MKTGKMNRGILLAISAAVLFAGGCASSGSVASPQADIGQSLFQSADLALQNAKQADAALYAPTTYEEGMKVYQKAQEDLKQGKKLDSVYKAIEQATSLFNKAVSDSKLASVLLTDVTTSRQAAVKASASEFVPADWDKAEQKFRQAARTLEGGDSGKAKTVGKEADTLYRAAELNAIRNNFLQPAWSMLEKARQADAEKLAPRSYAKAVSLANTADTQLTQNRYDTVKAEDIAKQAEYEAAHAVYLSQTIQGMKEKDQTFEDALMMAEPPLQQIAQKLNETVYFDQGLSDPTQRIVKNIENIQQEQYQLKGTVQEKGSTISVMQHEMGSLEQKLSKEAFAQMQLAKLDRIRSSFKPGEAKLLLEEDKVIIRLYGLTFPVGKSTIQPEYFSLLSNLRKAFSEYPDCLVTVQGHTDATGSAVLNQRLSTERAEAVRDYLVANMGIPYEQIKAEGYGASLPIANNQTAEGRALNRRIDVVIQIKLGT